MHEYLCCGHPNHFSPSLLNTRDEMCTFYLGSKVRLSELCLICGGTSANIINDQLGTLSLRLKYNHNARIH